MFSGKTLAIIAASVMGVVAYSAFGDLEGPAAASAMALPLSAAFAFIVLGSA